jgi:hypothetical protein
MFDFLTTNLLWIAGLFAFLLGLFPVFHHLVFGLRERKREIMELLDNDAIGAYFEKFNHAEAPKLRQAPRAELSKIYNRRFGARTFLLPGITYFAILAVALMAIATAAGARLPNNPTTPLIDTLGAFGLAGAYMWVVYDLIGRYRQRNMVPSALYFAAFRIAIIIPLAAALGATMKDNFPNAAASMAFLLGTFPTTTLFVIGRRWASKYLLYPDKEETEKFELEDLQGVTKPTAEAFSDIGVSTCLQLAYDDPIQLAMRTNLSFYYVLDLASQALVAIYVDTKIARRYSLRGSVETSCLAEDFSRNEPRAVQVVAELALALNLSMATLSVILEQIADDPYAKFINVIWDGPKPTEQTGAQELVLTIVQEN